MYICIYVCICIYACIYTYVVVEPSNHATGLERGGVYTLYLCTHRYIHTYIHTYVHTTSIIMQTLLDEAVGI